MVKRKIEVRVNGVEDKHWVSLKEFKELLKYG